MTQQGQKIETVTPQVEISIESSGQGQTQFKADLNLSTKKLEQCVERDNKS